MCVTFKLYRVALCYRSSLRPMSSKQAHDSCTAWQKALRVTWKVPYVSHKHVLAHLADCMALEMNLEKKISNFLSNVCK